MQTRSATLAAALAVLLLGLGAVASGCGSTSSSDGGVAELDDASTTSAEGETTSANGEEQDPQEAALEWAACMREHGVDVPDPVVEGDRVTIRGGAGARRLDDVDSERFEKAQEECGPPLGRGGRGPQLTPEQRQEMQDAMLEFAKCMREHGVDLPDPEFSGEGGRMLFRQRAQGGIDPDSETFREAQEACQDVLEDAMPERAGDGGPNLSTGGTE